MEKIRFFTFHIELIDGLVISPSTGRGSVCVRHRQAGQIQPRLSTN